MDEEKKFDELINSKLSEREFPFDELNWDEAERLIIRQARWSKIKRVSLVFSAGLALGVAAMLPFVLNKHNVATPPVASRSNFSQPGVVRNNVAAPINPSPANTVNNSAEKVITPLPLSGQAQAGTQSAFVKKENSTSARAGSDGGIRSGPSIPHKVKKETSHPILLTANTTRKTRKTYSHQKANPDIAVASATKANKISRHKKAITKESNPISKQVTGVNYAPIISNTDITEPVKAPVTNTNPADDKTINTNSITNPAPANSDVKANNTSNTVSVNKINAPANPVIPSNPADNKNNSASNSSASAKTKTDTGIASNRQMLPGTEPVYTPEYSANILSVYAGGNYSFGWTNNGMGEGSGFTPLGGFMYTRYFTQKFSASLGLGYSELNGLNSTYTSSIIQYDFGQNAGITTVTPKRVYYLAVPFKMSYNFNDKNIISAGLDFLFMLTTYSTLTTYQETPFGQTTPTSTMQNGYTEGFANYNFQFTMAYTRMLTDRLGIRPELYFGLGYVENNSLSGYTQYGRNSGVRLVFSYQLMK